MLDVAGLDGLARSLADAARHVDELADRTAADVAGVPWEGPAATRYRAECDERVGRLRRQARELASLASDARAVAADARRELDELRRIERRVRAAMASVGGDVPPPWAGTRWSPGQLPGSGSPAWRTVITTLRARGLGI